MARRESQKQREVRRKKGPKYSKRAVQRIRKAMKGPFEEIPTGVDVHEWLTRRF